MTDRRSRLCDQTIQHLLKDLSSDWLVYLDTCSEEEPRKHEVTLCEN